MAKNEIEIGKYWTWPYMENEIEIGKYSLRCKALCVKDDKGTKLDFNKGCYIELNCLAIKTHRRI